MTTGSPPADASTDRGPGARLEGEPRPGRVTGTSRRRLRVVHCVDGLGVGGTELNAVRTVEQLDPARYEVHLVTFATDGPLRSRYERIGVPIHSFPVPNLYGPRAARQALRLVRLLRRLRPDVLHSHDCYDNIFATACARVAGVPLVIASRRWWSALPSRAYEIGNGMAYRHLAHVVLANSPAVGRLVREGEGVAAERVTVVPNFLEPEAFELPTEAERRAARRGLGIPEDAFVVGCVAKLRAEKDHASLIRAVADLRDSHPDVHLALVGDGPLEGELRALVARLGVEERVHLVGYLPNRPNPHAWFDLSVLCSLHEGFPNSVIEAMAVARPVVATAVGGIPDAVRDGETGVLVPPASPERLGAAIAALRSDVGLRARLGEAGRQHVRDHHARDAVIARLEALYHSRSRGGSARYIA